MLKSISHAIAAMSMLLGGAFHHSFAGPTPMRSPQSKASETFYRERAARKRMMRGLINRQRVVRGEMQAYVPPGQYFAKSFNIETEDGMKHTLGPGIVSFHKSGDGTLTNNAAEPVTQESIIDGTLPIESIIGSLRQHIEQFASIDTDAASLDLPPGCRAGPLMGEITITDPALWEKIVADQRFKPKNKRKHTIYDHFVI